jgi:nitroreductase
MSVMTFLLAAQDAGLGALFFGVFRNEDALRDELSIPADLELLGAIALGYRLNDAGGQGRSSHRERRSPDQIIHRNGW